MPIIKHIPVHTRPKKFIAYILNGKKNDEMKYASGINCQADVELAYRSFKEDFERFTFHRFDIQEYLDEGEKKNKESIRVHHYIQSFKPGEVTPEVAHEIGVKWARKVFGDKFTVLISTHIDKGQVHTHFAVSVFDTNGNRWVSNQETYRRCVKASDELAAEYGLSIIKKPKRNHNHSYGEWLARKNGTSWKQKIADAIDRGIADNSVRSVDDLVEYLRRNGYKVNYGKYISVQGPANRKPIRSFRLGEGYSVEALAYRIEHKETEFSAAALEKYSGIQREYAMCLMRLQVMVYRKEETLHCATYPELLKSAELLRYIRDNNITTAEGFKNYVDAADEEYCEDKKAADKLRHKVELEEKIIDNADRYLEICRKKKFTSADMDSLREMDYMDESEIYTEEDVEMHRRQIEPLKSELDAAEKKTALSKEKRDRAGSMYRTYLEQMEGEFIQIRRKIEEEKAQRQECERNERSSTYQRSVPAARYR